MKETTINIIDGLRGQQAQLKRLLAQKVWISDAPTPELSEIEAQVIEVKRLLAELEKNIKTSFSEDNNAPRPQRREALRGRDRQCRPRHADRDGGD